jgi:hypothetical protein
MWESGRGLKFTPQPDPTKGVKISHSDERALKDFSKRLERK